MIGDAALTVFAKQPIPRKTKTRLSPPLTPEAAAGLYACFLADTLTAARQVVGVERFLAYDPPSAEANFRLAAPDFTLMPQEGQGLGERIRRTFDNLFAIGYRRVVVVGSDLPHLSPQTIHKAFNALGTGADLALGPSLDGGYYLVGMTHPAPGLFNLPMSTPEVFSQTLARARQLGLRSVQLSGEFDIDTPADLVRLRAYLEANPGIPAQRTRDWLKAEVLGLG